MTTEDELIIGHYKLPLKSVPDGSGYGYYGALRMTKDLSKLECHVCGGLFANVARHITAHKMNVEEYRETYNLAKGTALVSEVERLRSKELLLKKRADPNFMAAIRVGLVKCREKRRASKGVKRDWKNSLETKNKRGTCPDQLIARIQEARVGLGRIPTNADFIRFHGTQRFMRPINETFGSWNAALFKACGAKIADGNVLYTNDELLNLLVQYRDTNKKIPTTSDFKRGLLPGLSTYKRHFGSLTKARHYAGL